MTCLAAAAALVAAGAAVAAPLTLGLDMGTSYYQHSAPATSLVEFQGRTLEPLLKYARGTDRTMLWLEARRRFDLYSGAGLGPVLLGTHQVADHANVQLRQVWSDRSRLEVDGLYLRSSDVLDVDRRTLAVQSRVTEWSGNAAMKLDHLEASYHDRGSVYDQTQLDDARARNWTVRALPFGDAAGGWFASWHRRELLLADHMALGSNVGALGLRRGLWEGVSADAEVGASQVTYADGVRRAGAEAAFEIEGPLSGSNAVSVRLQLERAFPATLEARVGRRIADARVWVSGASLVDVEGGFYRYPTFTRRVGVGIEDTLGRATIVGAEASRGDVRPFHIDVAPASTMQASAWLARRLRSWLTGRAGFSYLDQSGDGESGAPSFRRFRVDATVTILSP